MYTKLLDIDGEPRLVFFARTDIAAGQEITFNYRCVVRFSITHDVHCRTTATALTGALQDQCTGV